MTDPSTIASRLSEAQSYGPDLGLFAARLRETRALMNWRSSGPRPAVCLSFRSPHRGASVDGMQGQSEISACSTWGSRTRCLLHPVV